MTHFQKRIPKRATADRYGVTPRTIDRWPKNPALNFPQPYVINGRCYFDEGELDEFDKGCARRAASANVAAA